MKKRKLHKALLVGATSLCLLLTGCTLQPAASSSSQSVIEAAEGTTVTGEVTAVSEDVVTLQLGVLHAREQMELERGASSAAQRRVFTPGRDTLVLTLLETTPITLTGNAGSTAGSATDVRPGSVLSVTSDANGMILGITVWQNVAV